MKINLGTYSKGGSLPKVVGPRRRINKKAYAREIKQKREGKQISRRKRIIIYTLLVIFFCVVGGGIWRFNIIKDRIQASGSGNITICDNIFNPQCWTDVFRPTFKQTDGFTNVLVVGLDSRPVGAEAGLKNTDSIIIASVNHTSKKVMLISIPRDMVIPLQINGEICCSMKINAVYALEDARSDIDDGLELLAENIENILGLKIHYKATVNFSAVKDGVDAVGGITMDIKDDLEVWYPDEEPPYQYQLISFNKGIQVLDGKQALAYARFRKIYRGPGSYASDFSRAKRQQEILDALKDKVLSDEGGITELAQKYWGIYESISDNIRVDDVSFEDALAGFSLINEYDHNPINIVLDPNFGGLNNYIFRPGEDGSYGYHIKAKDNTWDAIETYIQAIWDYPEVYDDQAIIVLSNKTATGFAYDSKAIELQNSEVPFYSLTLITETRTENSGVRIYDFSNGEKSRTIAYLKEYFGVVDANIILNPEEMGVTQTGYYEEIKVEFGPDEEVETD